jgi:hypothetical protein
MLQIGDEDIGRSGQGRNTVELTKFLEIQPVE